MNVVKSKVDAIRQDFREKVPAELAAKFTRKLTKHENTRMHSIGQSDILALGRDTAMEIMADPTVVAGKITAAEALVNSLGGSFSGVFKEKAKALAIYMIKKEVTSNNLLPNALAIANLYDENTKGKPAASAALIKAIGELTSLYAYDILDPAVKATLADLAMTQEVGLRTVAGFLEATRTSEYDRAGAATGKRGNAVAHINGWKGYIPALAHEGSATILVDAADVNAKKRLGFIVVERYFPDASENYRGQMFVMTSTVAGKNKFRQGVAQTVHATWNGVDARTGAMRTGNAYGAVVGSRVALVKSEIARSGFNNSLKAGNYLIPV